jgi:cbb3-type cytochrome c oxidase subunit III
MKRRHFYSIALLAVLASASLSAAQEAPTLTPDQEAGKKVYEKWCVNCHGETGQGDGAAADFLRPRPRDFTRGQYKIRSTGSGQLPTDQDLIGIITRGMPATGMPAWEGKLNEKEIQSVAMYLQSFSRRFARAKEPPKPVVIGPIVSSSAESIEKGRQLFRELECFKCHGEEGRADGPSAPELTDDWDYPIRPANLTKPWNFRGGSRPEDIYLRLHAGIAGTPMPSFTDSLDNEKTWHLVNYVKSLGPETRPPLEVVLRAKRVEGEIPAVPNDPFWEGFEASLYPLVGQVIKEPRMFTPTVDSVWVQAVYNDREIGFRLVWDDPTESQSDAAAGTFEDAVAVQLPVYIPTGAKRPFFLMGDSENAVQLLRWGSADRSAVEITGNGMNRLAPQAAANQETKAASAFKNGRYQIVMKRPLTTANNDQDIQFEPGRFVPVAFFVWDGSNGETGGKMAISHWYYLLLEPPLPKEVFIYPVVAIAVTGVVQWWVIRRLRKKSD